MAYLRISRLQKIKLIQKQANQVVGLGSKLKRNQISDLFSEKQIEN